MTQEVTEKIAQKPCGGEKLEEHLYYSRDYKS
jgi:hypothetical protein